MADDRFCMVRIITANCQPGRVVCCGNGKAALGGVWVIKNIRCFIQNSFCQPDYFFSGAVYYCIYYIVCPIYLSAEQKIKHGPVDYGEKDTIEEGTKGENPLLNALTVLLIWKLC